MSAALLAALRRAVGYPHVVTDPAVARGYEIDVTGRPGGRALAVVRPGSTSEVAAVLSQCRAAGVAVVPQGGNTGLVGGGIPAGGEVLLSLSRLSDLGSVDTVRSRVLAGAGVSMARLQQAAGAHGLEFGVDFGARDSATVGGLVATNAGGMRVLRYGSMRRQVAGLEAVLADGTVLPLLRGLPKDNTGYDLVDLLVGSEGTLAVITRVLVRLVPRPPHRCAALLALGLVESLPEIVARLTGDVPSLSALEFLHESSIDLLTSERETSLAFPTGYPMYLLVECAGTADPMDELAGAIDRMGDAVGYVAVASEPYQQAALWSVRDAVPEACNTLGARKFDVSVPLDRIPAFLTDLRSRLAKARPAADAIVFGHAAEGNLHINVIGTGSDDEEIDDMVLRLVTERGGGIGAEHGVGRAKQRWLALDRGEATVGVYRAIKAALDPDGILNPGVLLPA